MTGLGIRRYPTVLTDDMLDTAACRHIPDTQPMFFAKRGTTERRTAQAICARCPLTGLHGPCVQDAINHDDAGIRGGLSHRHRRRAVNAGQIQRQGICPQCLTTYTITGRSRYYCGQACATKAARIAAHKSEQRAWRQKAAVA